FVTLGLAEEFKGRVAVNALWPKTVIATDAINMIPGVDLSACRKPEIVADAAVQILQQSFADASGQFYIDESVLRDAGVADFDGYAVEPGKRLLPDLFL
ncbi:MAG: short chain dehydrogenase, partial [Arenimonas sp.]|nr:short chain dehydrogenase [Arenimonas sp.]